jgi:phage shock protein C
MLNIGLYRSRDNKWITGVCAGIAAYLKVNPMWVRLAALLLAIIPAGIGIVPVTIAYVALTVVLPEKPTPADSVMRGEPPTF